MTDTSARKADPKALTPEYHKAHKQLMLWSTLLFIWEFVGVDLGKAQNAGGYVGPVVTALKSPQAVPWVLLILVTYFVFKCSIEWAQCHVDRRQVRFAKVDYISALMVSLAAIGLYIVQAFSRMQLANLITPSKVISAEIGAAISIGALGSLLLLHSSRKFKSPSRFFLPVFFMVIALSASAFFLIYTNRNWRALFIGLLGGSGITAVLTWLRYPQIIAEIRKRWIAKPRP